MSAKKNVISLQSVDAQFGHVLVDCVGGGFGLNEIYSQDIGIHVYKEA